VAAGILLSRIAGSIRPRFRALLWQHSTADAFYAAFRIPNLLQNLSRRSFRILHTGVFSLVAREIGGKLDHLAGVQVHPCIAGVKHCVDCVLTTPFFIGVWRRVFP
jgi:hypothetical protein